MASNQHMIAFSSNQIEGVTSLLSISLPCPRTGLCNTYLYQQDTGHIYELSKVAEGRKTCWLVNNSVYKDGALYFITPIDPLFIILPIIANAGQKTQSNETGLYRTMDDIFTLDQDIYTQSLQRIINTSTFSEQLSHLCDTQAAPGMMVYRFNEERSLAWLQQKVDILVQQFETIPQFKQSMIELDDDKKNDHCLRESIYVLAKYLSSDWITKLFKAYPGVTEDPVDEQSEIVSDAVNNTSVDDYFQLVANKNQKTSSDAEKSKMKSKPSTPRSLAKVNTKGIKPLTSFFKSK
ncbi:ribonuclease H2, subunit B [Chlamydoabsidia padenii]|nr:ribonuclease H2, subunit B [Chlamydoabsidia padenii]